MSDIVDRMASACSGYDEWRVQDPKSGSYCMAFSWPETSRPENEARAWLLEHKARWPDSRMAHYEVACVRVHTQKDALMMEAVAEIKRLRAVIVDVTADAKLVLAAERERCATILEANADASHGMLRSVLRSNAAAIRKG